MTFDHWATVIAAHDQAAAAVEAARISAEASINAARITAEVTSNAAWTQGGATLLAGILAVGAGVFAYLAATRQVRLAERQHADMVEAFRLNLLSAVTALKTLVEIAIFLAEQDEQRATNRQPRLNHHICEYKIPRQLTEDEWIYQAMLGRSVVGKVHKCRGWLALMNRYKDDVNADRPQTVYDYRHLNLYLREDGKHILEPSIQGVPFIQVADRAIQSLNELWENLAALVPQEQRRKGIRSWLGLRTRTKQASAPSSGGGENVSR